MRCRAMFALLVAAGTLGLGAHSPARGQAPEGEAPAAPLPFQHKVEVYRAADEDVIAFTVRLEQPFLAEEFEKSNYLRLHAVDERAYLIYPRETKFLQKHCEFYGRLRGEGRVPLRIAYETVSENLDGSRRVQVREGIIEVEIPPAPDAGKSVGSLEVFRDWARQQNSHFARMLGYYPHETFFQYCLLQSQSRYGVAAPPLPQRAVDRDELEADLYEVLTGSLAIQEALQRDTLGTRAAPGDQRIPVATLEPAAPQSLDYEERLRERRERDGVEPRPHAIAKLVPADQYLLHFRSMRTFGEALDLAVRWGDNLLRLYTVQAQDHRLQAKLEQQLVLRRAGLDRLFADQVVRELALTGSDPYLLEGTDITVLLDVAQPELFLKELSGWLEEERARRPDLMSREFNYRGHRVEAHYTDDRVVSAFVVRHESYFVVSNSHRVVRRVIDTALGAAPSLRDVPDYLYMTTLLPPDDGEQSGYFFGSDAFVRHVVSPESKIARKRRLQCFNNLVMHNNASLFFRMEYGRSPRSLSELVERRFVDPQRIACPHGGAYAFDAEGDTCTCSLHNRLRYLTPLRELPVLNVSQEESAEYSRYRDRYQQYWQREVDPIAVRITVGERVRLETCVLPVAPGGAYPWLRSLVDETPQALDTARFASSAVASLTLVPGRRRNADLLRMIPGVAAVIDADPTLADMTWVGDRVSVHACDGEPILDLDPTRLHPVQLPFIGVVPTLQQAGAAALLASTSLPVYVAVDVESEEKAELLLEQFAEQIVLKEGTLWGLPTQLDAYRLPDYKDHKVYVLSGRLHAVSLRLHLALVGRQLVLATKPDALKHAIDASERPASDSAPEAHIQLRLNHRALAALRDDLELHWSEKARLACHRNIISIYNLHRLYGVPLDQIPQLAEAKYGVRPVCPDGGEYHYDEQRGEVVCGLHGNREHSRQELSLNEDSSFGRFLASLGEIVARLRFTDDALLATVEIERPAP